MQEAKLSISIQRKFERSYNQNFFSSQLLKSIKKSKFNNAVAQ